VELYGFVHVGDKLNGVPQLRSLHCSLLPESATYSKHRRYSDEYNTPIDLPVKNTAGGQVQ